MSGPAAFRHDPFTVCRLAARGPGMPGPYRSASSLYPTFGTVTIYYAQSSFLRSRWMCRSSARGFGSASGPQTRSYKISR